MTQKFDIDLRIIYKTYELGSYFNLKTPSSITSNVAYKFLCLRDAGLTYIGYSSRICVLEWKSICLAKIKSSKRPHNVADTTSLKNFFEIIRQCRSNYDAKIQEALIKK